MKGNRVDSSTIRNTAAALRREQDLCVSAVASGEYDHMTDQEWVVMCEQIAHEASAPAISSGSSPANRNSGTDSDAGHRHDTP